MPGNGCIDEMLELVRIAPLTLEFVEQYCDLGLTID